LKTDTFEHVRPEYFDDVQLPVRGFVLPHNDLGDDSVTLEEGQMRFSAISLGGSRS
jgi:hypothetical protein